MSEDKKVIPIKVDGEVVGMATYDSETDIIHGKITDPGLSEFFKGHHTGGYSIEEIDDAWHAKK